MSAAQGIRAQQLSAALPPDDPRLFHALFVSADAPQRAVVNVIDALQVVSLARASAKRLADLDGHRQTYLALAQAKKLNPNPATLQGFDASQNLLDWRGIHELHKGLSAKGWQELRAWVNGPFRDSVNAGGR